MLEKLKNLLMGANAAPPEPTRISIVHNYTDSVLGWERDISYHPVEGTAGKTHTMHGFSSTPILVGDYILLSAHKYGEEEWHVRYRIVEIKFENDPRDMFFGKMEFVNRTDEQKVFDLEMVHQSRLQWLDEKV